ncbi:MAG: S46 family peptidase [Bacteroidia bacterium]|nr:S46 family peptidase [Bacteroidia bacterium]
MWLALLIFIGINTAKADEGMWLLSKLKQINEAEMKGLGLKLSADDIYNINQSCLKDAIVQMGSVSGNSFGGFCTAEIVSDQGLVLTNHHCGLDAIQENSSVEHDYLTNGFWAMSKADELPNPGLGVRFLVRMEDVTQEVLTQLSDTMSEATRNAAITKAIAGITKKAAEGNNYLADVRGFYRGSEFYLFIYEVFKDVRLVGAPPYAIGNFGGDTDNWVWPRHTGDFSMFRIYANAENKPAEYAATNVPYKPKKFLEVSKKGMTENDYAMIIGFPGRTDRYATSHSLKMALEITNPAIVDIRKAKLDVINKAMDENDKVRIQYQDKKNQISNYWKYYIGQTAQLKRNKVVETKTDLENQFANWANANASRKAQYGNLLSNLNSTYNEMKSYALLRTYQSEAIAQGPEFIRMARGYETLLKKLENADTKPEEIKTITDRLKAASEAHFKNYDAGVDNQLFVAMMQMYVKNVPAGQQAPMVAEKIKANKTVSAWGNKLYSKTIFASAEKLNAFLANPKAKTLKNDEGFILANALMDNYSLNYGSKVTALDLKLNTLGRNWIEGLRKMSPDKDFYPDANSTIRLTYGTVKDYDGNDAISYNYFTTLDGIMEKMDPSNPDYVVPAKLVELYKAKDFGPYAENGVMKIAFITTNDITGGNSGSGILNDKGQLTGLAFDGNWEAMSGDIYYDPRYKRCINVDIRYVLFVIDKLGGAGHLVREMKLVD